MITELVVLALNVALQRWKLLLAPLVLAIPAAYLVAVKAPKTYQSQATILLSPAMQPARLDGTQQVAPVNPEQIRTLELWLKSDRILTGLVRQIHGDQAADNPEIRNANVTQLRDALSLELSGRTVLELKMTDSNNVGLGRKLEIVLSRLMESLIEPERGLLTAARLLVIRSQDQLREAQRTLNSQITKAGLPPLQQSIMILDQIHQIKARLIQIASPSPNANGEPLISESSNPNLEVQELNQDLTDLRKQLTNDAARLSEIEMTYASFHMAKLRYEQLRTTSQSGNRSYLATIGSPEKHGHCWPAH